MIDSRETTTKQNLFLTGNAQTIISEIPEEKMVWQPSAGINHPMWSIGHLVTTTSFFANLAGKTPVYPAAWDLLFKGKTIPTDDAARYPSKSELMSAFEESFALSREIYLGLSDEKMSEDNPHERSRSKLPLLSDFTAFLLTGHVAMHLGQLSMWRRLAGYEPLF